MSGETLKNRKALAMEGFVFSGCEFHERAKLDSNKIAGFWKLDTYQAFQHRRGASGTTVKLGVNCQMDREQEGNVTPAVLRR